MGKREKARILGDVCSEKSVLWELLPTIAFWVPALGQSFSVGDVISYKGEEGSHLLSWKVRAEESLCSCSYLSRVECWDMESSTLFGIL